MTFLTIIWVFVLRLGCSAVALSFLARFLMGPFSERALEQIKKHAVLHGIWAVFAILCVFMLVTVPNASAWPPAWWERRVQHREILARVERGGGWETLRRECESLVTNNPDGFVYLANFESLPLPPAIEALRPVEVRFYPPKLLRQFEGESLVPAVRIKLFGLHSTGGHFTPFFGLEIPCGPAADTYIPSRKGGMSGNPRLNHRKVADRVYEVY